MAQTNDQEKTLNDRAVLTVLGSDRSGIVAAVTGILATHNINILDISQTILQGIFTMTMLVDLGNSDVEFLVLHDELDELSGELQVQIALQREEVFKFMYRL
jgi:ACT domain-containing protein